RKAATPGRLKSVTSITNSDTRTSCSSREQHCLFETSLRGARVLRPHNERVVRVRRLKPCPRHSRHCESVLLEQLSPLSCYEVKAYACSESHSQADINVRILLPAIDL